MASGRTEPVCSQPELPYGSGLGEGDRRALGGQPAQEGDRAVEDLAADAVSGQERDGRHGSEQLSSVGGQDGVRGVRADPPFEAVQPVRDGGVGGRVVRRARGRRRRPAARAGSRRAAPGWSRSAGPSRSGRMPSSRCAPSRRSSLAASSCQPRNGIIGWLTSSRCTPRAVAARNRPDGLVGATGGRWPAPGRARRRRRARRTSRAAASSPSNTSTRRSSKPWWTFSSGLAAPALCVAEETVGIHTTRPPSRAATSTASGFAPPTALFSTTPP